MLDEIRSTEHSIQHSIEQSSMPFCLTRKLFDQCVLPVLTYGCETWTLNSKSIQKLNTTQWSMERKMLHITWYDKKQNTWIRNQIWVCGIMRWIAIKQWQWAGHIARRKDNCWTVEILNWIPRDHKRPRSCPKQC